MLTAKREGFLQSLRKGDSQRQAYKDNYNAENMTDKTIDEEACKLLALPKVNTRYREMMMELREKANEEGLMSATEVLRKLNELIVRNEEEDDRVALDGLKTYGKHHGLFTDKIELEVTKMPAIRIIKGEE